MARTAGRIALKRVYEPAHPDDGCRILVERLWPRGLTRSDAAIDLWAKEVAPSPALRKWFDHEPEKWAEFKRRYFVELRDNDEALAPIRAKLRAGPVSFVFASRETRFNNAVALKQFLEAEAKRD